MKNDLTKNRVHEICIDKTDCQNQEQRNTNGTGTTADLKTDSTVKDAYQRSQRKEENDKS